MGSGGRGNFAVRKYTRLPARVAGAATRGWGVQREESEKSGGKKRGPHRLMKNRGKRQRVEVARQQKDMRRQSTWFF